VRLQAIYSFIHHGISIPITHIQLTVYSHYTSKDAYIDLALLLFTYNFITFRLQKWNAFSKYSRPGATELQGWLWLFWDLE